MARAVAIVAILVAALGVLLFWPKKTIAPTTNHNTAAQGQPDQPKREFKVALVTPGPVNSPGWSQNAYDGLLKMKQELNANVSNTVVSTVTEAVAAFRDYSGRDFNLVIGHASEYFDPQILEVAAAHPKTTYFISASERAKDNVVGVRFLLEDGSYVLGQIAASMSKTGVLGCVGPKELPVIDSTFVAFEKGAQSIKKDIKVLKKWTNDWSDIARGKEQTLILLANGADFIFQNANDCAPGVFQAVQEKRNGGAEVYAFGSNADQTNMADDVILASAVLDIPSAFLGLGRKVRDGQFERNAQFLGMPEGVVWITYNPKLESKIPKDVRKLADETSAKIKSREFKAPKLDLK